MAKYSFYVDGFNMYYALNDRPEYHKYKWVNYRRLAELVVGPKDTIVDVYYFSAFVAWKPAKVKTHKLYIRALRTANVKVVLGRFMKKETTCHKCYRKYWTHEEKRTDVNIALQVLSDAMNDTFDRAILISADSDMLPVIEAVHTHAGGKEVGVMFPIGCTSLDLRQNADFRRKMREEFLQQAQFPDQITIGSDSLQRPAHWA